MNRRKFLLGTSAVAVSAALPVATPVTYEFNEVTLGYTVMRKAINDNLYLGDIRVIDGVLGIWDGTKWLIDGTHTGLEE